MAYTPLLDQLFQERLYTQLKAHGSAVGMPSDEDMGNSEVGHNAIGAGRVFSQGAKLVNDAIGTGAIFHSSAWNQVVQRAQSGGTVHFIGLLSDGNVHSNIAHLLRMLEKCAEAGVKRVRIHMLTDGRDVAERSALSYVRPLEAKLAECSVGGRDYRIGSGGGRMVITMDRYGADWSMVHRGWHAHVLGEGRQFASAEEAIQTYYDADSKVNDQYVGEFVIADNGVPIGTIEDGDAVVMYNFRGDRAIELSRAFEEAEFEFFDRKRRPDVFYAGMMQYDGDKHVPKHFLVEPPLIAGPIGQYLCGNGVKGYAISETQKFGHVTYFWNGNRTGYIDEALEKYVDIRSDQVPFEQRPWMKSAEITDAVIETIQAGEYKFIRLNYPNGDMVGHTGIPIAVRISVEAVDLQLERLLWAMQKVGGIAVITADHGNADCMWTEKNGKREPHMAHTLNPVPFIIKDYSGANKIEMKPVAHPGLSNIAATLINLLGFEAPAEYDESLITIGG
jgi:2,3-bisphosphoglycerate-independent phosphoglycerate mutase